MTKDNLSEIKFFSLLEDLHIHKPKLVSVSPESSIRTALSLMAHHNILSLPVHSRSFPERFSSIISTFDILSYLVANPNANLDQQIVENALTLDVEDESYRIWERDVRDTLKETLEAFSHGTHRALITDALEQQPSLILTQTDIVRFIYLKLDTLAVSFDINKPIRELAIVKSPLITLDHSASALTGYKRMKEHRLLALPVTRNSEFVNALSNSHLRGADVPNLELLNLPVEEFLARSAVKEVLRCDMNTSFMQVLEMVVKNHLHRVWVVEGQKPVGVVSLSDIIAKFSG